MLVEEMTREASLDLLGRARLGRLACVQGEQPYVVPFQFAYHDGSLYSFSTVGKKIEWMRANPLVCVEADEISDSHDWATVVVFGCYEELPDTPQWEFEREFAWKLLQQYSGWWEAGFAKPIVHAPERPPEPVFYRIRAAEITGRRGTPDRPE